ncbi:hypothetical protein Ani05nite_80300 [Amorphoplanes nipponensis]|uniref:Uncharacterized protein n=1 Tax=Actinoplanes nipponensis TaxID=135950 RepID=A0A919JSK6_9ACTN|nr:hypothetical protein Ani05nite_80300 [Actinoplanes nipponensis]
MAAAASRAVAGMLRMIGKPSRTRGVKRSGKRAQSRAQSRAGSGREAEQEAGAKSSAKSGRNWGAIGGMRVACADGDSGPTRGALAAFLCGSCVAPTISWLLASQDPARKWT